MSRISRDGHSTEDVDVLIERVDEATADELVVALDESGFRGPAMPLTSTDEMLDDGDNIWVAPEEQVTPPSK